MKFLFLFSILPFFVCAQNFSEPLNIHAYLGRWYQVYSNFFVASTFERNAKCVLTDYGLYDEKNISVYNEEYNTLTGSKGSITGYAVIKNESTPRKLAVTLNGGMSDAPYWIYETGPILQNHYEYSIVSDDMKIGLFVLARNVETFFTDYNEQVLDHLTAYGFTTFFNKPILTNQKNCVT